MTKDEKLKFIEEALEKGLKGMAEMVIVMRDLTDCLEDMTDHYVEVRNDLFGMEAAEEMEVIAARKMICEVREGLNGLPADGSKAVE